MAEIFSDLRFTLHPNNHCQVPPDKLTFDSNIETNLPKPCAKADCRKSAIGKSEQGAQSK